MCLLRGAWWCRGGCPAPDGACSTSTLPKSAAEEARAGAGADFIAAFSAATRADRVEMASGAALRGAGAGARNPIISSLSSSSRSLKVGAGAGAGAGVGVGAGAGACGLAFTAGGSSARLSTVQAQAPPEYPVRVAKAAVTQSLCLQHACSVQETTQHNTAVEGSAAHWHVLHPPGSHPPYLRSTRMCAK